MTPESDKVTNITGSGCIPYQEFTVRDTAVELLEEEEVENLRAQSLTQLGKFKLKVNRTLQIRKPKKPSG